MVERRSARSAALAALGALGFCAVALSYLPVGYLLRYAALRPSASARAWGIAVACCAVAALLHERFVRGTLYEVLRGRLPAGVAGPTTAIVGAAAPLAARLAFLPQGGAPLPVVVSHAFLVEYALSLGLTWLALGTGSTLPGSASLAAVWIVRLAVAVSFRGGIVPLLEVVAAILAAGAVAGILHGPLTPHREAVLEET